MASPFPRYGLSVPAFPSHSGHMLLFGGLVHDTVKNDLWSIDVRDCSSLQVKTKGDAPMPRVGHASAIADRIMLAWGGDTKVRPEDSQDESLYILDLRQFPECDPPLSLRKSRVDSSAGHSWTTWTIRPRGVHARHSVLCVWRSSRRKLYERSLGIRHQAMYADPINWVDSC